MKGRRRTAIWTVLAALVLLAFGGGAVTQAGVVLSTQDVVLEGPVNFCIDSGTTDSYACSLGATLRSYVVGAQFSFKANTANTGACTLNLNGLGAKAIKKTASGVVSDPADNDIGAGQIVQVQYDGTNFQLTGAGGGGAPTALYLKDSGGSDATDPATDSSRVSIVTGVQSTNIITKSALALQSAAWTNGGASGDIQVIAGSANQTIGIYGFEIYCNGANNWLVKSGTTNSPPTKLNLQNFVAGQGKIWDLRPDPWMEMRSTATATDNDFTINFSAAQTCSGLVYYTKG